MPQDLLKAHRRQRGSDAQFRLRVSMVLVMTSDGPSQPAGRALAGEMQHGGSESQGESSPRSAPLGRDLSPLDFIPSSVK